MARPKIHSMDESYGTVHRVTGASDATEALKLATDTWANENAWCPDEERPRFDVESDGWYRCIPCICGDGHTYDVFPAEPHARGATYTYLIGYAPRPAAAKAVS